MNNGSDDGRGEILKSSDSLLNMFISTSLSYIHNWRHISQPSLSSELIINGGKLCGAFEWVFFSQTIVEHSTASCVMKDPKFCFLALCDVFNDMKR